MDKSVWGWVVGSLIVGGLIGFFVAPTVKQPTQQPAPATVQTAEDNKTLVQKTFEELDRGNLDGMDALLSDDFVTHFPGNLQPLSKEQNRKLVEEFRVGLPDLKHTLEEQIAEVDRVVTRGFFEGTHQGELQGIKPTGKQVKVSFILVHRVSGGKITEEWVDFDSVGLLQQLGALPTPAP